MDKQNAFAVFEETLETALRHPAFRSDSHALGGGERAGQFRQHCELQLRQSVLADDTLHLCSGHAEIFRQAYGALHGVGINADNAEQFLDMGARQVIVTSYVFKDGRINYENLKRLSSLIGAEHLVLDLSCRKKDGRYYIVTDRWQKFTEEVVTPETLDKLAEYCSEYLIHAVDVEGKAAGIETELATMLGTWGKQPMTYAGGVGSFDDLESLKQCGQDRIDVTVGSALDIFGGALPYDEVVKFCS